MIQAENVQYRSIWLTGQHGVNIEETATVPINIEEFHALLAETARGLHHE